MMRYRLHAYWVIIFMLLGCKKTISQLPNTIVLGGDLSNVNEVEEAGAKCQRNNSTIDPYGLFDEKGCNLVLPIQEDRIFPRPGLPLQT